MDCKVLRPGNKGLKRNQTSNKISVWKCWGLLDHRLRDKSG